MNVLTSSSTALPTPNYYYRQSNSENSIVNGKLYYLNNSRTKYVNIGLNVDCDFTPCIELGSKDSCGSIVLTEDDYKCLVQHQGTITSYFYCTGYFDVPIRLKNATLYFDQIDDYNVVKIKNDNQRLIYLGSESVCKLFELVPVIDYRLGMLLVQQFEKYFTTLKSNVNIQQGDLFTNLFNILSTKQNQNNENICTVLELLIKYPDVLEYKLKYEKKKFYDEISKV